MRIKRMFWACMALLLVAVGLTTAHAQETAWKPEGNVEFVVGAGAGGENDRIARAIQHVLLKEKLVESMTVLNRPGAAQTIAINYLAQRRGHAHEIGLASGSFINAIARNGSQLHRQVTSLIKLFDAYQGYFTAVDSSIKDMADVRDRLKSDPSSVSFGLSGRVGHPAPCFRCQCRPGGRRPVAEAGHGRIQLRRSRRGTGGRPSCGR